MAKTFNFLYSKVNVEGSESLFLDGAGASHCFGLGFAGLFGIFHQHSWKRFGRMVCEVQSGITPTSREAYFIVDVSALFSIE